METKVTAKSYTVKTCEESMNKQIELSLEKARELYGKNPEMDELLLANFTKEELIKKELPKSWYDLKHLSGFYIGAMSNLIDFATSCIGIACKNTFVTKKQANSALAMAQLSQLMAIYNNGWEQPNSECRTQRFYIILSSGKLYTCAAPDSYHFLTFKSAEIRDEFLKNFESLIKEYFMID